ncbi:hypothetical protein APHAL10511_000315 [Amanita phalloides]|nr:hypothetical protein APHAL10511_000315 [Amanita phalloides]
MATVPVNPNDKLRVPPLSNLVRCSDLWFEDGNLVLVAASAAFKVHRGQLKRHSEFFSGLLMLAEPRESFQIDGCDWIQLHDCPSDVLYFLRALYDGLYFKIPHANDFPALAAVLRLSTKYFVEHLRQHCLARLDLDWPGTLAGWDFREAAATDEQGRYVPRMSCAHPILVIRLALEQGIPSVLYAAMYDLSRYGPSKIILGTEPPALASDAFKVGGDTAAGSFQPSGSGSGGGGDDSRGDMLAVTLPHDLLLRTLKGREYAQKYLASFVHKELQSRVPSAGCVYKDDGGDGDGDGDGDGNSEASRPCHDSFYFIMLNLLRSVGGIAAGRDADPLFTLLQAADMLSRTDFSDGQRQYGLRMCQACKVEFAAAVARAREEVWALLPSWFTV